MLFLLFALVVGLLASGRADVFRRPWIWTGGALALLIWLPNIVWNAQHDWAAVSMMQSLHDENSTLGASLQFVPAQLVIVGPVLAGWLIGLKWSTEAIFYAAAIPAIISAIGMFSLRWAMNPVPTPGGRPAGGH